MSERSPGQIITFYSYKGGVGRSMALANVAVLLAQKKRDVLVIDFDLEAPGLHRYFPSRMRPEGDSSEGVSDGKGTIELFYDLAEQLRQRYPAPEEISEEQFPQATAVTVQVMRDLLDSGSYWQEVRLRDPGDPAAQPRLRFMPAGRFDDSYPERARRFDWRALAEEYPFVFDAVAQALGSHEFVLLDSRTGITDVGGVCTALLPSKLALVFSLNEQSLHGAVQIGKQAVLHRATLESGQLMPILPLPSRVEQGEEELTKRWLRDARQRFEILFRELYGAPGDLAAYFEQVRIPHKTYYAFGEKIAAESDKETESQSLTESYARFLRFLLGEQAETERSGPHAAPTSAATTLPHDSVLLISLGGDSLWPTVNAARTTLGLTGVPEANVLDMPLPAFIEPDRDHWTRLAGQLRERIRPWVDNPTYQRFHLFYRGPVVMAPLLGAIIAPNKPLHIYYYENGTYRLAYVCDRRMVKGR